MIVQTTLAWRWLFSTLVATSSLCVLVAMCGLPRRGMTDLLYIWLAVVGVNNLRIALARQ